MVQRRPTADRIEVSAPAVAAALVRVVAHAPASVRKRVLHSAFERAAAAFNRGDLDVVFALFSDNVEYIPPPPLQGEGMVITGKQAVTSFWREVFDRYPDNSIENLTLVESAPTRFVRTARLRHGGADSTELDYVIRQVTELVSGRVVRQVNDVVPVE